MTRRCEERGLRVIGPVRTDEGLALQLGDIALDAPDAEADARSPWRMWVPATAKASQERVR
jgi:hypothetical protein